MKKSVTKSKSPKSKKMAQVQEFRAGFKKPTKLNPLPYFRYSNVSISDISNEKFPEMVQITNGPAKYREIMGKKYVNEMYAKLAVDEIQAYSLIGKGEKSVKDEMEAAGILPLDNDL